MSLEAPAVVDELEAVPALALAVETAVAALDAAVEEPAAVPAEVELAEEPDCAATARVSACRRLEKRSTPNEDWPEPESPREESPPDFPGVMCGGVKPTR